jgi:hypothetical protein
VLAPAVPATTPLPTAPSPPNSKLLRDDDDFHSVLLDSDGNDLRYQDVANLPTGNGDVLTQHWIDLTLNFEHSRRLRLYQFDPLHHDVSIFSIH